MMSLLRSISIILNYETRLQVHGARARTTMPKLSCSTFRNDVLRDFW